MTEVDKQRLSPPRMYLGLTFLFWGALTNETTIGLICALAVEFPYWIRQRWALKDESYSRAWKFGCMIIAMSLFLAWMNTNSYQEALRLLRFLPLLLVPVQVVERFSEEQATPVNIFSYFSRKKQAADLKAGRPVKRVVVPMGYATAILAMIGAAFGKEPKVFVLGVVVFLCWFLFRLMHGMKMRGGALIIGMIFVSAWTYGFTRTAEEIRSYMTDGRLLAQMMGGRHLDPRHHLTGIGRISELKQSKRILWRAKALQGSMPNLLRENTYLIYENSIWRNPKSMGIQNLASAPEETHAWLMPKPNGAKAVKVAANTRQIEIKGGVQRLSVLPLPSGTEKIRNLDVYEVTSTDYECVRLDEPNRSLVEYVAISSDQQAATMPTELDTLGSATETRGIKEFIQKHGLRELPRDRVPEYLEKLFANEFTYTLELGRPFIDRKSEVGYGPISRFLNERKQGYCEYFATASVLIMRELGVPARYAVGFACHEQSGDEIILRGLHAHAWVRYHDGKTWRDMDPTPPDWLNQDTQVDLFQRLIDVFFDMRDQVTRWRTQGNNALLVSSILGAVLGISILLVAASFLLRHWRRKQKAEIQFKRGEVPRDLKRLTRQIQRIIGPRPAFLPYADWLKMLEMLAPEGISQIQAFRESYEKDRFGVVGVEDRKQLIIKAKALEDFLKKNVHILKKRMVTESEQKKLIN